MVYTVKQLAEISGVSVRTLHYYDEIGLLRPAYHEINGYRIYSEKEQLLLQQILFYRELGFKLKMIHQIIHSKKFSKKQALLNHREMLESRIEESKLLIETIDRTIKHIDGEEKMIDKDFYKGLDPEKQKKYEKYIIKKYGHKAEEALEQSQRNYARLTDEDRDRIKERGDLLHKKIAAKIEEGCDPTSDAVQELIQEHFDMQNYFHELNKNIYIELGNLYNDYPEFKKFHDEYHPQMAPFLRDAMRYFAEKNL